MRIYLDQIGCRLNYSEMETLASRLRATGHTTVTTPAEAQVIVFNTCAVTNDAVRGSRKQARHFHSVNPGARIALTGCWATLEPKEAAALPGVALVAHNEQKELLHTLLEPWSVDFEESDLLTRLDPEASPLQFGVESSSNTNIELEWDRKSRTRAFIKVQDGCNNKCTFCIVTLARGDSRSRTIGDIVSEVQDWVAQGAQEVVLTGVHLGSYGRDLPSSLQSPSANLQSLIQAVLSETEIARVRLSSLEPWELADGFFELWQRWPGRLCPHLHLPLQAGTNRQLRAMARRCTTESYRQLVVDARSAIPDLILTTDLIVGFPGETEADFQEGLRFVEEMRFTHAHVFPFSARPGTAAAKFGHQINGEVKKERGRQMRELVEATGRSERQRFIGTVRSVLWEGQGQPLSNEPGSLWSGLTDNYLRVMSVVPTATDLHNCITPVFLQRVEGDVFVGDQVEALV
ncbi:MAG: tRNA (N(6)-L-threonylcarbamoyladenosine(37)-C(2))-methylthiotransferase MtaB [Caldilineaceae bacterium]